MTTIAEKSIENVDNSRFSILVKDFSSYNINHCFET